MWAGGLSCNKKNSRAERSCTILLNALQEVIQYSFIKFYFYCFFLRYEFFVQWALRVEKIYQHDLDAGHLECLLLRSKGYLTNPFRIPSLCFGVIRKTPGLISHNNFVKNIFVCIGHHYVLASCDSIFPLLRCQECEIKRAHNFLFPKPSFGMRRNTVLGIFNGSAIILDLI
jgi:hypothetical protein